MLRNFITDTDLKKYHPNLQRQIWTVQSDYSTQIAKSYDRLINDLNNFGINPMLTMTPLDLKKDASSTTQVLTSTTETTATTGSIYAGHNERRLVVNVTAHNGSGSLQLQGNRNTATPTALDSGWENVSGALISWTSASANSEQSIVFTQQYNYYRYVSSVETSATYTVSLLETVFDDLICYGTFILIFNDFMKESNDLWDTKRQIAENDYKSGLQSVKYWYDSNNSGTLNSADESKKGFINITLVR